MKTFVLSVFVLLSPVVLSAQALASSNDTTPTLIAKSLRASPSKTGYKLQVVRPSTAIGARLRVGTPDTRIDYKILTQNDDRGRRARTPTAPKR